MEYIGLSTPWAISKALNWRRQHAPSISDKEALLELHAVCSSGKVRMRGTRREANPSWPTERIIAVRFREQQRTWIPATEFAELYFDLENNFQGGTLNWLSSREPAWWPVEFASDELINVWLCHLASSRPTAALQPASLAKINEAITAVYDDADAQGKKPPNLNELVHEVKDRLKVNGNYASKDKIQAEGKNPKYANRRRMIGVTVKSEKFS